MYNNYGIQSHFYKALAAFTKHAACTTLHIGGQEAITQTTPSTLVVKHSIHIYESGLHEECTHQTVK